MFSRPRLLSYLMVLLIAAGCRGPSWQPGYSLMATRNQVAQALGEPEEQALDFQPDQVPRLEPPSRVRPCCSFGMDLHLGTQDIPVPFYHLGNITSADGIGHHEYNNGAVTVQGDLRRGIVLLEKNGLVYTCRGGFVDIAHLRDYADLTQYVALELARILLEGGELRIQGDGAVRRIELRPVPIEIIEELGPWQVAADLAQWVVFHLSLWHEVATWYGWETVSGIPEKGSAFSPEDVFSNTLGIKIAAGLLVSNRVQSRYSYVRHMDAWIHQALEHLGAVDREQGRRVMKDLDGLWWDSSRRLPDWRLVTRRNLDIQTPILPWVVQDLDERGIAAREACGQNSEPLGLTIPEELAGVPISELVTLEIFPGRWAGEDFPFARPSARTITQPDLLKLVELVREDLRAELGEKADQPIE